MDIKRTSVGDVQKKKGKSPITMLTAYDYNMARILDRSGIDIVLVGDSVGNVVYGHETTLPVTIEQMVYHTQAVVKGAKKALVVADMPFLSIQVSPEETRKNAGLLLKEGGAQAVKVEVSSENIADMTHLIEMGIPVMAHIGVTPQAVHQMSGYKRQGGTDEKAAWLEKMALACEKAGCFAIVVEMVDYKVSERITQRLTIPTIGIGAGPGCDGQVLVTQDMLGLTYDKVPGFVKAYGCLNETIEAHIKNYSEDVKEGRFP